MGDRQLHAKAILGVVFKQGIGPRGTMAVFVHRIGANRCRATVNGGTSRGVCDHHAVPEQLGDQFDVRGFTASGARP